MDRQTPQKRVMPTNFITWLQHGIDKGWLTETCLMHRDLEVYTDEERYKFNVLGEDPCVYKYVVTPPE